MGNSKCQTYHAEFCNILLVICCTPPLCSCTNLYKPVQTFSPLLCLGYGDPVRPSSKSYKISSSGLLLSIRVILYLCKAN